MSTQHPNQWTERIAASDATVGNTTLLAASLYHCQYTSYTHWSKQVQWLACNFFRLWKWRTWKNNVCVCVCLCEILIQTRGKLLLKRGKCFNKPSEMNVWDKHSILIGTVISKQEERRLMKIPEVDDIPRQQTTFTSMQFVIWFAKIAV